MNGKAQLLLPGIVSIVRLPDGNQGIRVVDLPDWLTVQQCCDLSRRGEDIIYARIEDGTLTYQWKNHVGARGTLLIHAGSFKLWLDSQTRLGRLHPELSFK